MKGKFLKGSLAIIKNNSPNTSDEELEIIAYGLEGLYLTVTKFVILIIVSVLLGMLKEVLLLSVCYNIIRFVAFGMHAKNSSQCMILSLLMFIGGTIICLKVTILFPLKITLAIISVLILIKYAPADTEKRPIISKKRRNIYKNLSVVLGIIFTIVIIISHGTFLSSFLLIGMIEACIMIHPLTYKLFKLPYDNYKKFNYGLSN